VTVELPGLPALRFAFAYGFRNIQNIVPKVKRGKLPYDFVEVMACPSGRHTVCIKYESEFKAFICATASVTFFWKLITTLRCLSCCAAALKEQCTS